jgi:hypothetical protein
MIDTRVLTQLNVAALIWTAFPVKAVGELIWTIYVACLQGFIDGAPEKSMYKLPLSCRIDASTAHRLKLVGTSDVTCV